MLWTPYQRRWLEDLSAVVAANKSRQVGFSEVEAFKRAVRALGYAWILREGAPAAKPIPQNIISASERQSLDLLRRVKVHLEALAIAATGKSAIEHENAHEIVLENGARLRAFAPNPRTIRSVNGDVTLDEFAANREAENVWKVVFPMVQANLGNPDGGWQLSIISTPEGDTNKFHEVMKSDKFTHVSRHTVTIHDAAADGFPFPKPIEQLKAEYGDPDAWAQEYEGSFLSSSMRYISDKLWDDSCVAAELVPAIPYGASRFGGYDIGRHHDASAYAEVALVDEALWQNGLVETEHKLEFEAQELWIQRKIVSGLLRFALDAGGMGEQPAELFVKRHGVRVDPVKFTSQSKEVMATGLKLMLDRGKLHPRKDDLDLRREVLLMRRVVTDKGAISFDVQREKGAHGDRAWALALAVYASRLATTSMLPLGPHALMPKGQGGDLRQPRGPLVPSRRGAWNT